MAKPTRLTRVEVWSDLQCAGGTRLAFERSPTAASEHLTADEGDSVQVSVPVAGRLWELAEEGRVLRTVLSDRTWQEWRIVRTDDTRDDSGALLGVIEGETPLSDLADADEVIGRREANGSVSHDFGLYGLTPAAHLAFILGWAPTHFAVGAVEPVRPVDLEFAWDSPLSALRQLEEVSGAELVLERDGAARYLVHLRTPAVDTAPTGRLRYRKNLAGVKRDRDFEPLLTRAYPRGAGVDGFHADMGQAAWAVVAVAGSQVTLEEGVVAFPGQLDGLWVEEAATGYRAQIQASGTDQVLTLSAPGAIAPGDLLRIRVDGAGAALTRLDNPVAAAKYLPAGRHKARVVDRPDIPGINNLAPSPFLDTGAGVPAGWQAVGAASLSREVSSLFRRYGDASVLVEAAAAEVGIETEWIPVQPSAERPYFSVAAAFWLLEGAVRLELVAQTADGAELVFPAGGVSRSNQVGTWTENLAVSGIDLAKVGATAAKIRLVADGAAARWYLDAGQLVQDAAAPEAFYNGRSANDLWREANRELLAHQDVEETYDVRVHDLFRLDPEAFEAERLEKGAVVRVEDAELGVDGAARIVELTRNLLVPGEVTVRLSTRLVGLTGQLAGGARRDRGVRAGAGQSAAALQPFGLLQARADGDGTVTAVFAGNELGKSFGWRASTAEPPPEEQDAPTGLTVIEARSGSFNPGLKATPEQPVWITGYFFPQPGGQGTPGRGVFAQAAIQGAQPVDPAFPLADGRYLATLDEARKLAAEAVAIAQAYQFSANTRAGEAGTEISKILTLPLYDSSGTTLLLDTLAKELKNIAFGTTVKDSQARLINQMLLKTDPAAPDDARGIAYTGGVPLESLRPAQAGADITGQNTAADVLVGVGKAVRQAGADVTGQNTAADTAAVAGTSAAAVKGGAAKADAGLEASGDVRPGKVKETSIVDTLFATAAIVDRLFGHDVFAVNVFTKLLAADTVVFKLAVGETIVAGDILVQNLSALSAVLGTVAAGIGLNALPANGPTAGIRLSSDYALPGSLQRYIDLAAAAAFFIYHPALKVPVSGPAEFAGDVRLAQGRSVGFYDNEGSLAAELRPYDAGAAEGMGVYAGGDLVMLFASNGQVTAYDDLRVRGEPVAGLLWGTGSNPPSGSFREGTLYLQIV